MDRYQRKISMSVTIHQRLHLKTSGHATLCGLTSLRRCLIRRLPKRMKLGSMGVVMGSVGMVKGSMLRGVVKGSVGMVMGSALLGVIK